MKTTTTVKTKPSAREDAVTTNLTINWEGMSEEDTRALAQQALIVKLQAHWRNNSIPEGDFEVDAVKHKVGTRAERGPVDVVALAKKMSPEERAALIAKLMAAE